MHVRPRLLIAAVLGLTLAFAGFAFASNVLDDGAINSAKDIHGHKHAQHGDGEGHLANEIYNVKLISKLKLKNVEPEKIADVGVHKGYAYLAAWGVKTCKYNGVHVVDVRSPAKPKEVAFIGAKHGSYPGEGIQALSINTAAFKGDILVSNNEKCNATSGFGGMNIYDITRPTAPVPLFEGFGDKTVNGQGKKDANEIHSVFAWQAGDKAYAVMVDNEESADVDIVDITNPKKPKMVREYDLLKDFPGKIAENHVAGRENLAEIFHHDMIVKEINGRQIMLVSYWDGGYVKLDVTNPANAKYLGDTDFGDIDDQGAKYTLETHKGEPVPPEGNGHQAEFTRDNKYFIGTDEDFDPFKGVAENTDDDTPLTGSWGSDTPAPEPGAVLEGKTVFVGRACNGDPTVPPAPDTGTASQIAVVERGLCTFTEKVANVEKVTGYEGVIIFNRTGSDACNVPMGMSVAGSVPTFGTIPRLQGFALFNKQAQYDDAACLSGSAPPLAPIGIGSVGDAVKFTSYFDGWGYVRLFENGDGKITQLDTYAHPAAFNSELADGFGDLSIHEVATSHKRDNLAYFAYYAAGFRVARIKDGKLVETGAFIDVKGSNFWGVEVFQSGGKEYVAASDRDHGLYIFEYTGPGKPNS
ncbi:MAG TPA: PA domain-containing protein [Egibacteraceae bacterium]|nr:PA domain-containing protein [Egibacteraceae bacterium]